MKVAGSNPALNNPDLRTFHLSCCSLPNNLYPICPTGALIHLSIISYFVKLRRMTL